MHCQILGSPCGVGCQISRRVGSDKVWRFRNLGYPWTQVLLVVISFYYYGWDTTPNPAPQMSTTKRKSPKRNYIDSIGTERPESQACGDRAQLSSYRQRTRGLGFGGLGFGFTLITAYFRSIVFHRPRNVFGWSRRQCTLVFQTPQE